MKQQYIAIDLKSFYASAECVARGLDPLNTNLVVADETKTEKQSALRLHRRLRQLVCRADHVCLMWFRL